MARDLGGGLLQRDLNLGERWDRHAGRHQLVENAILAQIGVGQHIIADGLAVAQPRAMAHHEPAIGAQHRQMVGDVLRVGRPDADVDQRDAGIALPCQMVGGHLVAVPGRACRQRLGLGRRMLAAHHHVAG